MSAATVVVKTFVNENGQVVAMDSYGSWRVYSPQTKSFGAFAKGPKTPVSEAAPAGVTPEEAAAPASSHPPPPPNNDELVRLRDELSQMKEVLAQAQAALLDSKEKRQAALDELALVRAAKMQSDADKTNLERELVQAKEDKAIAERNFSARATQLGEANDKVSQAEAALAAEIKKPKADPAEVAKLRLEVDSLTKKLGDAETAQNKAAAELIAANTKLAAKPSLYGYARPAFSTYPKLSWAAVAALVLVVLLAAYGLKRLVSSSPPAQTTQTEVVPADNDSVKSRLADVEAKQAAREKADAALAEGLKKLPSFVPLTPSE